MTALKLRAILDELARTSRPAVVRFQDGEVLELRVVSTLHADEGGDFAAELLQTIVEKAERVTPGGTMLNIELADVASVGLDGVCLFGPEVDP